MCVADEWVLIIRSRLGIGRWREEKAGNYLNSHVLVSEAREGLRARIRDDEMYDLYYGD